MAIKPSLKDLTNTGYLGHFKKDKFIQEGHNNLHKHNSDHGENLTESERQRIAFNSLRGAFGSKPIPKEGREARRQRRLRSLRRER